MLLSIKLLGLPTFVRSGAIAVRMPTRRADALLAFLAERGGEAASRKTLSNLLWPRSAEEQARASLRQEISVLRKALGPEHTEILSVQSDSVAISPNLVDVDVWRVRSESRQTPADVLRVLQMHSAPFLNGFRLHSRPFTNWTRATRHTLKTEVIHLGQATLENLIEQEDFENAREIAQELSRILPTHELAHRALIENYRRNGDLNSAQRQFDLHKAALKADIALAVSEEALELLHMPGSAGADGNAFMPNQKQPTRHLRFITTLSVATNIMIENPEEFCQQAEQVTSAIRAQIEARGGVVARIAGDHVLAYFDNPIGRENSTDIAFLAALDVLEASGSHGVDAAGCQIGLSYGQAVISTEQSEGTSMSAVNGAVLRRAENAGHQSKLGTISLDSHAKVVLSPANVLKGISADRDRSAK
jgi:DNA-binding SARP family transcriptional activator